MEKELVIKALEYCSNNDECVGEACPYYATSCENKMPKDALSLIKELTQKLELANLEIECKERICESYMLQYGTVADKEVWLKRERADTVQKMQELIKERCIKGGIYPAFVASTIDQIAKEMIGETE